MNEPVPTIQQFMTASPHTIGDDQPMALAHRMMREHDIRHLPVLRAARIVGVVSDRDLNLIELLAEVDPTKVLVSEAMASAPYVVAPDTTTEEVVSTMAAHKYGSAIVAVNHHVVGIFTTVDACRVLAEFLHERRGSRSEQRG